MGEELGAWARDDLSLAARAIVGIGADAGLTPLVRFRANVAKLLRVREARKQQSLDEQQIGVFLLQPVPPQHLGGQLKREPFLTNGLSRLVGRIWFVNELVKHGMYVALPQESDDDVAREIERLDMRSVPAIQVEGRLSPVEVRVYPNGLGSLDSYEIMNVRDRDLEMEEVLSIVDRVHRQCLVTPDAQIPRGRRVWQTPQKWWPVKDVEALIQSEIRAGLVGALDTFTVRHEQPGVSGRTDLEIERESVDDPSRAIRFALLELKALRSFSSTGKSIPASVAEEAIEDGLSQAISYRDEKNFRAGALCCFDLRSADAGDICFDAVKARAEQAHVALRRWFIYASAKAYRAAQSNPMHSAPPQDDKGLA
jgi:hypothetical protein